MADKEMPKEGRFSKAKSLKKDLILEQALLHKLRLAAHDLFKMPQEELEKLWPQTSNILAAKNAKKTEREFLSSVIMEAQINIQLSESFKQKYDIDLSDERTKQIINQQAQALTIGH